MGFGSNDEDEPRIVCPLCGELYSSLGYKLHLAFDARQIKKIADDHPDWVEKEGACFLCVNLYRQHYMLPPLTQEEFAAISDAKGRVIR